MMKSGPPDGRPDFFHGKEVGIEKDSLLESH